MAKPVEPSKEFDPSAWRAGERVPVRRTDPDEAPRNGEPVSSGWADERIFGLLAVTLVGFTGIVWGLLMSLIVVSQGLLVLSALTGAAGFVLGVVGMFRDDRQHLAAVGVVSGFLALVVIGIGIWWALTFDFDISFY